MLAESGALTGTLNLIQRLYRSIIYTICWNGFRSSLTLADKNVPQGCPLSPLLFVAYINELAKRLENSDLGYRLGQNRLPALLFADDILLISKDPEEMQRLLNICAEYWKEYRFDFCKDKSQMMVVNPPVQPQKSWNLGDSTLGQVTRYEYLGVTINNTKTPLEDMALQLAGLASSLAFHFYSRYELVLGTWKGVAVPSLTYASDVLCFKPRILQELDLQ